MWTEVIGDNVRRGREAQDLLQEELARDVRLLGPKWSYTTVVRTEGGQREPSASELLALAVALQMPLSELLAGGDGDVETRPDQMVPLEGIRKNIAGNLPPIARAALDWQQMADTLQVGLQAEAHAARRLGRTVSDVRVAASALWGRPYHVERDHRLQAVLDAAQPDPETRRAQRGHVSRKLLAELRHHFAEQGRKQP